MSNSPLVGVVMGSDSDWSTMKQATEILSHFGIPFEKKWFPPIARPMTWQLMAKKHELVEFR